MATTYSGCGRGGEKRFEPVRDGVGSEIGAGEADPQTFAGGRKNRGEGLGRELGVAVEAILIGEVFAVERFGGLFAGRS
jgi:hypothetical protein